jgi:hypothetical protein
VASKAGAFQGQYQITITVEGEQAEKTLSSLSAAATSSGTTLDSMGLRVTKLGGGLQAITPAAAATESRMLGLARGLSQVSAPLGQMIQSLPGVDAGLLSAAGSAGGAGLALGGLTVAATAAYAISTKAAQSFTDQALALETAARAAGALTPEISGNADKARDYQKSAQELSDTWSQFTADMGELVIPTLKQVNTALDSLIGVVDRFTSSDLGKWLVDAGAATSPLLIATNILGTAFGSTGESSAELTRRLNEQTKAAADAKQHIDDLTVAQQEAAAAATQYASDQLSAAQADLRVKTVQSDWDAKVAAATAARQKAIDDAKKAEVDAAKQITVAKKSIADAQSNVTDVERRSANAILDAKQKVADAEARLRADSRVDEQSTRSVADAKLRLARVEQDIASGRLSGVDATRAYEDASQGLQRVQDDTAQANVDHQAQIERDIDEVAASKRRVRDVEVQAAKDIASAKMAVTTAITAERDAETKYGAAVQATAAASRAAGISANDRARHELDVKAAVLASHAAHQKLNADIATMVTNVRNGTWQWATLRNVLDQLHVKQFPNLIADLKTVENAQRPTYSGDDSADRRSRLQVPTFNGVGGGNFTSNVTINGVIADKNAANAIGAALADAVHKQLLRYQNSGQDLGFGKRH